MTGLRKDYTMKSIKVNSIGSSISKYRDRSVLFIILEDGIFISFNNSEKWKITSIFKFNGHINCAIEGEENIMINYNRDSFIRRIRRTRPAMTELKSRGFTNTRYVGYERPMFTYEDS